MFSPATVKSAVGMDLPVSNEMMTALELWRRMYINDAPWLNADVRSLNLPAAVASEMARLVTLEMQSEVAGGARAKYLGEQYDRLLTSIQPYVERACALGGMAFKPYLDAGGGISVDCTPADRFFPLRFDSSRNVTAGVFVDRCARGRQYYTRFEVHEMDGSNCIIHNKAYVSNSEENLGMPCALSALDVWAELQPETTIENVERPLFGYFRVPLANNVDPESPLGVSVYARAVEQIRQTDEQWARIQWEYEGSELAIDISDQAFQMDPKSGKPKVPKHQQRLFRPQRLGGVTDKPLYEVYSPTIRDSAQFNGLNRMLQRVEFNTGLAYGTLSDPQTVEKTAEEIKASKQRSYSTVRAMQTALQSALTDLVYAMDVWTTIGGLAPAGEYEVTFVWDDSIVTDTDKEFAQRLQMVGAGAMRADELRQWYLGESEEEAKKNVPEQDAGLSGLFGGDG